MLAVERVRHRFVESVRAKIVREHRRPRDRLQRGPMRAGCRDERNDHEDFADPDGHRGKLNLQSETASAEFWDYAVHKPSR